MYKRRKVEEEALVNSDLEDNEQMDPPQQQEKVVRTFQPQGAKNASSTAKTFSPKKQQPSLKPVEKIPNTENQIEKVNLNFKKKK